MQNQGIPLFKAGDMYWRVYQGALVPAPATTCYVELKENEVSALLKESGALFVRYSSNPCSERTEWWHVVCEKYNFDELSSNTRSKINRGNKRCHIKCVDAEWMAINGYECYAAAFDRYRNMNPLSKDNFRDSILSTKGGPFEYWGVFVEDRLAGYCQCIIENNEVTTNIFKYDPSFLKFYTSYALINFLLSYYIVENGMRVSNGARSIAHDTNTQDFLLKFGFRRQFCKLNIVYKPLLRFAIQTFFPLRKLIYHLPDRCNIHKIRSLLFQEELKRSFQYSF